MAKTHIFLHFRYTVACSRSDTSKQFHQYYGTENYKCWKKCIDAVHSFYKKAFHKSLSYYKDWIKT